MGEWIGAVSAETSGATPALGVRAGGRDPRHRLAPSAILRRAAPDGPLVAAHAPLLDPIAARRGGDGQTDLPFRHSGRTPAKAGGRPGTGRRRSGAQAKCVSGLVRGRFALSRAALFRVSGRCAPGARNDEGGMKRALCDTLHP